MMKCVLALVVLLHLCGGSTSNTALYSEIITRLEALNNLSRSAKVALPASMILPNPSKTANLPSCVSHFVTKLKEVLVNVTVHKDSQHILKELEENLKLVVTHEQDYAGCKTKRRRSGLKPFQSYVYFFQRLNNLKKK